MMNIWAHRGLSYEWPENTLQAFEAAIEYKIKGIELDIQLSKDKELVVIHDEKVDRTTNGSGNVADLTLKELKQLKIETKKKLLFKQYTQIPTMVEVLDVLKDNCVSKGLMINIELKNSIMRYAGMEEKILKLIKEKNLESSVIYSSFNPESIRLLKELNKNVKTGILQSKLSECLNIAKIINVDALHPCISQLDVVSVQAETTLPIRVWGGEEPMYPNKTEYKKIDIEAYERRGVTDIITNMPHWYTEKW